ncbi:MAG: hypothetical protein ACRC33_24900 [Gemmataceae bacterium]
MFPAILLLFAADAFDLYLNRDLDRLVQAGKLVKEVKRLTPNLVIEHDRAIPRAGAAMLIVRTNGDRVAKLLVTAGKQKVGADRTVPILLVERFVTFKEGEERQVIADGKGLALFHGFRLGLDLGQVVPEEVGGDLRFVADGDKTYLEPLGKARLFVVVEHDKAVEPKAGGKFAIGDKVEPKHFTGSFKLYDDGRRSGRLVLTSDDDGKVAGAYYSDRDGAKYDVHGRVGPKPHAVEFAVRFPRTEQTFKGMLFTGGGRAMAGTSRLSDREAAFYAVRED